MKNLFIDSNIWLSLYHFSNTDLEQFEKLKELLNQEVKLFVPQQVIDEVARNREAKLKDALTKFSLPKMQYPAFCKSYVNYNNFKTTYETIKKDYDDWLRTINEDIANQKLPADKTINLFFNSSSINLIIIEDDIIFNAVRRYNLGNPPGKDKKYGDAVNWECLLKYVPDYEDLYFVTEDKDYLSSIDSGRMNPFLLKEWQAKKQSNIIFHKSLLTFLNTTFDDIRLLQEQEKEDLIRDLQKSPNFATTHYIIAKLTNYTDWNQQQIEELCDAAIENKQVLWILTDEDVKIFYYNLLKNAKPELIENDSVKEVYDNIMDL